MVTQAEILPTEIDTFGPQPEESRRQSAQSLRKNSGVILAASWLAWITVTALQIYYFLTDTTVSLTTFRLLSAGCLATSFCLAAANLAYAAGLLRSRWPAGYALVFVLVSGMASVHGVKAWALLASS